MMTIFGVIMHQRTGLSLWQQEAFLHVEEPEQALVPRPSRVAVGVPCPVLIGCALLSGSVFVLSSEPFVLGQQLTKGHCWLGDVTWL